MNSISLTRRLVGTCAAASALSFAVPGAAFASTTTTATPTVAAAATTTLATINKLLPTLTSGTSPSACTTPSLGTPFSSLSDSNLYALLPGESADAFAGTNWTLGGGAKIVSTKLSDGTTGNVLDVPAGGYAISPATCVTSSYASLRAMVRSVGTSGVAQFADAFSSSSAFSVDGSASATSTWAASSIFNFTPTTSSSWQLARFAVLGTTEMQVYDLYVDPRMKS
jgi:hypothetical protein